MNHMKYLNILILLISATAFAQSTVDEDTVHFVGQSVAFTVGDDIGENPTFNGSASGWTVGTWTYGGNAISEDNAGADSDLTQNIASLTDGAMYRIQYEVTAYTDGAVTAVFDGVELGDKTSIGIFTAYAVATGTDADIDIRADATFTGTVDNVFVVEWVGHLSPGGGTTIAGFSGTLSDYMTATGQPIHIAATLAFDNNGSSKVEIAAAGTWDTTPQVGTLVYCDFSATLASGEDDGVYEITEATSTTIDIDAGYDGADAAKTVSVWIGGAFPDIATAVAEASTLSEDLDGIYRKRSICVNVDNVVDASLDFVAETSESNLRNNDGSRKIIGFYNSISVVQPDDGYRVVSDVDEEQTYYGGARKAFNQDEGFTAIRPDGKWIEWNANGNAVDIIELNTSNFEMRNIKAHDNGGGAGIHGVLYIDDATIYNITLVNCWFATVNDFVRNDQKAYGNSVVDCYFSDDIADVSMIDFSNSYFLNCIFNGTGRGDNINSFRGGVMSGCIFYKGGDGLHITSIGENSNVSLLNCLFIDQTITCVNISGEGRILCVYANNIFSPVAASDFAIDITDGSITPAGFSNIMYSVTAGVVLTKPINHDQISPDPPLPVGTLEIDPRFVNAADGDYRLQLGSQAVNSGVRGIMGGRSTIGIWQPIASAPGYRARYNTNVAD